MIRPLLPALLATLFVGAGDTHAHPHHDHDATRPVLLGLAPDVAGEVPRLLVRHFAGDRPARLAAPVRVVREQGGEVLDDHAHGEAVLRAGGTLSVTLLIDDTARLSGDRAEETREALQAGLRRTFTPGDSIDIRVLRGGEVAARLPSTDNLDELLGFIAEAVGEGAPASSVFSALDSIVRERAAERTPATHREILLVGDASNPQLPDTAPLIQRAREAGIVLSLALLRPADETGDDQVRRDALCVMARETGGLCISLGSDTAALSRGMEQLLSATRSVFLTRMPCLPTPGETERLRVETDDYQSDWMRFPGARLACPEPTPRTAAVPATTETASGPPAWLPLLAFLGLVIGGLILFVAFRRGRSVGTSMDEDVFEPTNQGSAPSDPMKPRIDVLTRPPNDKAIALTQQGPASETPSWLEPAHLEPAFRSLRRHTVKRKGPTLLWTSGTSVHEVPLKGTTIRIGNAPGCAIQDPTWPDGLIAAELLDDGGLFHLQPIAVQGLVRQGQDIVREEIALHGGENFTVAGTSVFELRGVKPGNGRDLPPALRAEARVRIVCGEPEAWAPIEVAESTLLLGRDPLPYAGVQAVPCRRVLPQVSNDHLLVWRSGGIVWIRDLGSANGTWIGGERITPGQAVALPGNGLFSLAGVLPFRVEING